jgi:nitroimidazol reductase NimA-like FMN-containing flavoprotein (pyridoxamine 5'-phosphate oxidase superfamily)
VSDLTNSSSPQPEDPRTHIRRSDRAITNDARISEILRVAQVGFIATSLGDQPYLHSNLFWFDEAEKRIYFHTAHTGRTRTNIEGNPKVCFGIAEMGDLIPADIALEFSTEYTGVIAFGCARVIDDVVEAEHGLYGLLKKYFPDLRPGEDYHAITADELARTSIFAIDVETWSGKQKKKSA